MKKKILCGLICLVILFSLTGCAPKKAITTSDFTAIAENNGLQVVDITDQYAEYGYINEGTVALSDDGWQIEFYVLDEEETAISMFNQNKANFEAEKGSVATRSSANLKNYSTYTLNSDGKYMHICRIDNTLLYVHEADTYKDDIKAILKELGY